MRYMRFLLFTLLALMLVCSNVFAFDNSIVYKSVENQDMKIAFSFDDGPHPTRTCEILEILEKYNISATFFVVGENAVSSPDILRQIRDSGHEIANHSFSHRINTKTDKNTIYSDIKKAHDVLLELCEVDVKYFRPPGGGVSSEIVKVAKKMDYDIILWDIDTKDWTHKTKDGIVNCVLSNIKSGSIILFHDYISGESHTPEALDELIPKLLSLGYTPVTVGELIESSSENIMPVS